VAPHYNEGVPTVFPEVDAPAYRTIHGPGEEGGGFLAELDCITDFYVREMRGRVRDDGPGVRLKWSRDWEYPWILTRAAISPGLRVLDCGAGNSPVTFLMAARGASVVALDRDALVASRARYAWLAAADWFRGLTGRPLRLSPAAHGGPVAAPPAGGVAPRQAARRSVAARAWRFLRFNLVKRHATAFSRISRPDFWGPVSPDLLARYGVTYMRGDLTQLPFSAAGFDVVSCISVLEHMPPDTRALGVREMARVLKPGGRLLLTYDRQDRDLTRDLVAASGLEPVELARLEGVIAPSGRRRPDAIALHLRKPAAPTS